MKQFILEFVDLCQKLCEERLIIIRK